MTDLTRVTKGLRLLQENILINLVVDVNSSPLGFLETRSHQKADIRSPSGKPATVIKSDGPGADDCDLSKLSGLHRGTAIFSQETR